MTFRLTSALVLLTLSLAACSNVASTPDDAGHTPDVAAQATTKPAAQLSALAADVTPPTISAMAPANGAIGVPYQYQDFTLKVAFNEPMNIYSVYQAFQMTFPNMNTNDVGLSWDSSHTVMTMKYHGYADHGTVVVWKIGPGATDAAGNHLSQTGTIGGSFRLIREKTVTLYSDPAKDLAARRDYGGNFNSADRFGAQSADVGWKVGYTKVASERDRAFLQFPLSKIPNLSEVTRVTGAYIHFNRLNVTGSLASSTSSPRVENITTPYWFQEASLWDAPQAIATDYTLGNVSYGDTLGEASVSVTEAMDYDVKHSASLIGLSQWRIYMGSDADMTGGDYHFTMGLGANLDPALRPYLVVSYEYP